MRTSEKKLDGNLTVPGFLFPLFWDCRPEHVQVDIHADFVMARVMERGTWEAMRWLLRTYSKDRLISFLEKKGRRTLPPRELNYWALMAGISRAKREDWARGARERTSLWSKRHAH